MLLNPWSDSVLPVISELADAVKTVVKSSSAPLPPPKVVVVELALALKNSLACDTVELLEENDAEFAVTMLEELETLVFSTLFKLASAVVLEIETEKDDNDDSEDEADEELFTLLVIDADAVIKVLFSRSDLATEEAAAVVTILEAVVEFAIIVAR